MRLLLMLPYFLKRSGRPGEMAKTEWVFDHHIDWDASPVRESPRLCA